MKTETWGLEEVEEKLQEIDGHTQVKIMKDNGVELVECIGTRCEHQGSLLQEQREMVGFLEVDCDQVGPVGPNEIEQVSNANGSMQSLGGVEASGSLVRTPTPDVIVPDVIAPECVSGAGVSKCVSKGVQNASVMACVRRAAIFNMATILKLVCVKGLRGYARFAVLFLILKKETWVISSLGRSS